MEPAFDAAVAGDDFAAAGVRVFPENKGVIDRRFEVEEAGAEAEAVEKGAGFEGPDFVDVDGFRDAAEGWGGAEFLHAGAAEEVAGELADGLAGEEVEGFKGGDEKLKEFNGGAEGGGQRAEGRRDFAASLSVAAARGFPAFWRVENTGFHGGKYEQDFKKNQVFSLILKNAEDREGRLLGGNGRGKGRMRGRKGIQECYGPQGQQGRKAQQGRESHEGKSGGGGGEAGGAIFGLIGEGEAG